MGSALSAPAGRRRQGRAARLVRWIGRLIALGCVAAVAVLVAGFFVFVDGLDRAETLPTRHAEGVVALTGGAERISDAVALLARGDADRMLITGVNPNTSSGELARRTPEARDLLKCCIDLGYRAADTVGNAAETSRWVHDHNIRSLIVVTSNYHMPRALAEIGHAAPGVDLYAFPVVTDRTRGGDWWDDGRRLRLVVLEYLKYVAVLTRLRVAPEVAAPTAS